MKKLLIVVLLSMMYIFASAQKYEDAVKFLPINVHYNSASVEWEHQEGKNSLVVGIGIPYWQSIVGRSYGQLTLNSTDFKSASLYTYTIRVAYRHYFSDTPMEGIYLEGYAKSQTLDWCAEINKNQNKMAAGSITGYFYMCTVIRFPLDLNISFKKKQVRLCQRSNQMQQYTMSDLCAHTACLKLKETYVL